MLKVTRRIFGKCTDENLQFLEILIQTMRVYFGFIKTFFPWRVGSAKSHIGIRYGLIPLIQESLKWTSRAENSRAKVTGLSTRAELLIVQGIFTPKGFWTNMVTCCGMSERNLQIIKITEALNSARGWKIKKSEGIGDLCLTPFSSDKSSL